MANNTISQIKLGNTVYDICDYTARKNTWAFYGVDCSISAPFSYPSGHVEYSVTWVKSPTPATDWTYLCYAQYNTASTDVFLVYAYENGAVFCARKTGVTGVNPTASQIYLGPSTIN